MATDKIWYDDLRGAFSEDSYHVVVPLEGMTFEQKLNATVRFFLYLGVLLAILKSDARYLFFGIAAAGASALLYEHRRAERARAERFLEHEEADVVGGKLCARSTVDNPFMNPSVADFGKPGRPAACDVDDPRVQDAVAKNFNARLFKDVSDLYGKMSSQREFYTVPVTTVPNDAVGFAEWCYGRGTTCKEGNGTQCYGNQYRYVHN